MIKNLQKQLTLLYTLTTGAILSVILLVCFFYMQGSLNARYESEFSSIFLNISNRFQTDSYFTDTWLAETESEHQLLIYIEENQEALFFPGAYETVTKRDLLLEKAEKAAAKYQVTPAGLSNAVPVLQTPVFTVKGENRDSYMGMYLMASTAFGYKSLLVLQDISDFHSQLLVQGIFFLLTGLAGILLLLLASWHVVGRTLLPIKENQKKQAEFIAAASHELRSPLAVIQASASAARTEPETAAAMMGTIEKECTRMGNLLKDLLVLAAADSRRWQLSMGVCDSDTLLLEVYESFQPVFYQKGLRLKLTLPDTELPRVRCDKDRVIQILSILVDNAMTYTKTGESVDLEVTCMKKQVCFLVADHGEGIPDEEKKQVFDRFYQSDKSRREKEHFGLGLSIAKELAELQKGKLLLKDTQGGGCTFLLKLEAEKAETGKD